MNIFYLDEDLSLCAQYSVDKHITKMPTETCQILSTVLRTHGYNYGMSICFARHPCTLWAGNSIGNFYWLRELGLSLCKEYTYRYGKIHKCEEIMRNMPLPQNILRQNLCFKSFPKCMPNIYKVADPVESYRNYYRGGKTHLFGWKKRESPWWIDVHN